MKYLHYIMGAVTGFVAILIVGFNWSHLIVICAIGLTNFFAGYIKAKNELEE